jgi:hypothetical protein
MQELFNEKETTVNVSHRSSEASACDESKDIVLHRSVPASTSTKNESEPHHAPSVHMHLGKDISKVGKIQRLTSQPNADIFLTCDYSAPPVEDDDLLSLFADPVSPSHAPKRKRSEDLK